jgi:tRNA-dihydrouridine synthase
MSKVAAHWELASIPVQMAAGTDTLILGNGDIKDLIEARAKVAEHGLAGVMLGRAIYGNPWLFAEVEPSVREKLMVLVEHTRLFEDYFGSTPTNTRLFHGHTKSFAIMKKHFKAYVEGFPGAPELRSKLMEKNNADEVAAEVSLFLSSIS